MALSEKNKQALDFAFDRLLQFAGLPNSLPFKLSDSLSIAPLTVENHDFYVDTVLGSDSASGSTDQPLKTIQGAVDRSNLINSALINIFVRRGTYAETVRDNRIYSPNPGFTSKLNIEGIDFDTPTIGSGAAASGTITAQTVTQLTVSVTTYTTNELRGMMLKITSGALNGRYLPIAGNTSSTIQVPNTANINGQTYLIQKPAVIITRGSSTEQASVVATNVCFAANNGLVLKNLQLNSGTFFDLYIASGGVRTDGCILTGATANTVQIATMNCAYAPRDTFIQGAGGGKCIAANDCDSMFFGTTVLNGGAFGFFNIGIVGGFGSASTSTATIVQNATTAGLCFQGPIALAQTFANAYFICQTNAIGLQCFVNCNLLLQFCEFTANTSHGIALRASGGQAFAFGFNTLNLGTCKIQNNGGDGILMESSHNVVNIVGTTDISGNTGFGIRQGASGTSNAGFNNAFLASTITMSTNTAGDLTLDTGTTPNTLASLRADADKSFQEATRFNRIAGS